MKKKTKNISLKLLKLITDLLNVKLITLPGINTSLVKQNISQTGGDADTQMVKHYSTDTKNNANERFIEEIE
jgi:hypothetical protein